MYRHGERAPNLVLPNDEVHNGKDTWPNGLGAMSLTGVKQLIGLGKYIRHRYDGFLSRKYVDSEVHKHVVL
jgi:hypothetical protein